MDFDEIIKPSVPLFTPAKDDDNEVDAESNQPSKTQKRRANMLTQALRRKTGQAIMDYNMIEEGDKVMVCLSGGKDSYTLLDILEKLRRSAPINFTITAVNLDQKQPGFPEDILPDYLAAQGYDYHIIEEDTYSIVKDKIPEGKTTCSLCSRLRRGILYSYAIKHGFTKIALGHHRDDLIETLFLNMFHGGKIGTMPPKLLSDDGQSIVIRPLVYCKEKDIEKYAELQKFPIIPCNLCGSQENLQRKMIKHMLHEWQAMYPQRIESIFAAMQNISPSHMLDQNIFDHKKLGAKQQPRTDWLVPNKD
ncbi:MAG: tRNA 2-thiocytidine(32) synthetase TtcA [Alphaproteobacteria bacterium]